MLCRIRSYLYGSRHVPHLVIRAIIGGMSGCTTVLRELERHGLLLQQDKSLPSVVGLITGEALSSSWWNHSRAQQIFDCLGALVDRNDVLMTRLISRKLTYVHRSLWPAFLAVATSREEWQTRGLSPAARALLRRLDTAGSVKGTGPAARELQDRLLVHAVEVHTDQGRHAMALQPWRPLVEGVRILPGDEGKRELERVAAAIGATFKALPWNRARQ
jgi:hypothetical protein